MKYDEVNKTDIKIKFKKIGAPAAAANLLFEFKMPEKKEDRLTNNRKGNVIFVSSTAKLNLFKSFTNPGAIILTKKGVKISTISTIKSKIIINSVKSSLAKFSPFFFPLIF